MKPTMGGDAVPKLRPDALILDTGLPDMDGYARTRRLPSMMEKRDARYIALTGYGQKHGRVLPEASIVDAF